MGLSQLAYIDLTGYHFADFPAFLQYYTDLYKGIFGDDVYLGPDSQDGQFIAALAQAAFDTAALGAAAYNSFSPATAQGVGLSRVVKINGIKRAPATNSQVPVVIMGTAGTVLTNAIAVDTLNQQWLIPNLTIPFSGTITVTATAKDPGAILALVDTVTGILTPTKGWQSVNNPSAATPGAPVVSDALLRTQQAQSVALPSLTVFDGTMGAVAAVSGVTASMGYENDTDITDGNGLPPHSIAVVVAGGSPTDIAAAIQIHKTPGTNTYGTTSVPTVDSRGMPLTINFFYATDAVIHAEVTIAPGVGFDSGTVALIQAAMAAAVSSPTIPIGGTVILTKLYQVAYLPGTPQFGTFTVTSIRLAKNAGPLAAADINLLFNEIAVCDPNTDVTVIT